MNRPWIRWLPGLLQRQLQGRYSLQEIISNSSWMFADTFFRMFVGLILGTLIARYLGPEDFGLLRYAAAIISVLSVLATLGLDGVVVRELSLRPNDKGVILGSAFAIKLCGGLLAYGLALAAILYKTSSSEPVAVLIAILGPSLIFQAFDTATFWFQSQLQAQRIVLARGIAFIAVSALRAGLLLAHADLLAFAWAGLLEVALTGIALTIAFRLAGNPILSLRFQPRLARHLLQNSWPLAVSGMFVLLTMQLDKILLGEMAGDAQVGIYSVANQLSAIWYMVPMIIGASIAPALFRAHAAMDPTYALSLQKVYAILTRIAVPTAIVLSFSADAIMTLLFGARYEGAGRILAIHIWGAVFVFHVSIRSRALLAEGKQKFVTAIAALTFVANLLFNLMFISEYGAQGAAWASLVSWILCATVFPALWLETRPSVRMFLLSFKVRYQ